MTRTTLLDRPSAALGVPALVTEHLRSVSSEPAPATSLAGCGQTIREHIDATLRAIADEGDRVEPGAEGGRAVPAGRDAPVSQDNPKLGD